MTDDERLARWLHATFLTSDVGRRGVPWEGLPPERQEPYLHVARALRERPPPVPRRPGAGYPTYEERLRRDARAEIEEALGEIARAVGRLDQGTGQTFAGGRWVRAADEAMRLIRERLEHLT